MLELRTKLTGLNLISSEQAYDKLDRSTRVQGRKNLVPPRTDTTGLRLQSYAGHFWDTFLCFGAN